MNAKKDPIKKKTASAKAKKAVGAKTSAKKTRVEEKEAKGRKKAAKTKKASSPGKKTPAEKPKQSGATRGLIKKSMKAKAPTARKRLETKPAAGKRIKFLTEPETLPELPKEYGEDELIVMVVDPNVMYAAWEVTKDTLAASEGDLRLRLFDITNPASGDVPFLEINIEERVGTGFFEVKMPGRKIRSEVGIVSPSRRFTPVLESTVVSFPELLRPDEMGVFRELLEREAPLGY